MTVECVTVIMVTWNSGRHVHAALTSLDDAMCGLRWHVVVADNA